jgi:hypothetical protein
LLAGSSRLFPSPEAGDPFVDITVFKLLDIRLGKPDRLAGVFERLLFGLDAGDDGETPGLASTKLSASPVLLAA